MKKVVIYPQLGVVGMMCMLLIIAAGALPLNLTSNELLIWNVSYITVSPLGIPQQVIGINGDFPGPIVDCSTNDVVEVTVFNHLDEPLLFTWVGLQHRHNAWQDGVSGTNCPIPAGWNWTYRFQVKDQIGSFFYYPSTGFQRAAGGYGGIRVSNGPKVPLPFAPPTDDLVVLIGDWYTRSHKELRKKLETGELLGWPDGVLINGYGPYNGIDPASWVLPVDPGNTYRLRISNVGLKSTLNFRLQNHRMLLVETEGSYTRQQLFDSLDVHVGQSYSVLVTADQVSKDYYIMASPRFENTTTFYQFAGVGIMHYRTSPGPASGPHPLGPDPDDIWFSLEQERSINWNLTAGAARPNPQGSYHYGSLNITQSFLFKNSAPVIDAHQRFAVNNVSYIATPTPLKLADYFNISSGVYTLDAWPLIYSLDNPVSNFDPTEATAVVSGTYKEAGEIVFENTETTVQSWHIDGYSFWVVGIGRGLWTRESRRTYNLVDAVARCTTQKSQHVLVAAENTALTILHSLQGHPGSELKYVKVYPRSWTAVFLMLDNPGIWNVRSENLQRQYLGQQLYLRVVDPEIVAVTSPYAETIMPDNVLYCGWLAYKQKIQTSEQVSLEIHGTLILLCVFVSFTCNLS